MPIHGNGGHAKVVRELTFNLRRGWIVAVGDNAARKREAARYTAFAIGIHRTAVISPSASIGVGTVIMAGAIVQAGAVIGKHVILNTGCTVDHDCVVEDFAHIAPGVHLCGGVHIGEGALVGVGSCAVPKAKVAPWTLVKAGSVVK